MGAWIETDWFDVIQKEDNVASFVGAWIEAGQCMDSILLHMSHPSWVRGLKPKRPNTNTITCRSHHSGVRGLNQDLFFSI